MDIKTIGRTIYVGLRRLKIASSTSKNGTPYVSIEAADPELGRFSLMLFDSPENYEPAEIQSVFDAQMIWVPMQISMDERRSLMVVMPSSLYDMIDAVATIKAATVKK